MEINGVELEVWLGLAAAVGALALWALKRYQKINADGEITLDEVIGTAEESEKFVDAVGREADKVDAALKARKCSVCGNTGHNKRTCPDKTE